MSLLYKLAHNLFLWIVPVLIVFYSISFMLPNGELQKKALREGDFYNKLSSQLRGDANNPANLDPSKGVEGLITSSVVGTLATPQWLQNLMEKNIDLTSGWFGGQEKDWALYLPTQDINQALSDKLDDQTNSFLKQHRKEVTVCSPEKADEIKKNGFDLSSSACLPQEVVDGKTSLTDFMAIKGDSFKNNFLSALVKNNQLNTLSDQFKVARLGTAQSQFQERLNYVRDWSIWARRMIWVVLLLILVLLLVDLILAKAANRTFYNETQRLLLFAGFSTLGLSLTVMLILGGSAYLTSFVNQLLLPGLLKSETMNILLLALLRLVFNLVSYAVWIGGAMVVCSLIMRLLRSLGWLGNTRLKNQKLQKSSLLNANNNTLDGQFRASLQSKVGLPSTQGFDEPVSSQNFDMPPSGSAFPGTTFNQDAIAPQGTEQVLREQTEFAGTLIKGEAIDPQNGSEYFNYGMEDTLQSPPIVPAAPEVPQQPAKSPAPVILPTPPQAPTPPPSVIDTNQKGPRIGGL